MMPAVDAVVPPTGALWCDRCGGALDQTAQDQSAQDQNALDQSAHRAWVAARAVADPRDIAACRRRMKVQVLPTGWIATCVEHGETRPV
jgi:hypothetical protein